MEKRVQVINGPILTVLMLFCTEWLSHTPFYIPQPSALHLTAVVYSAATGGLRPGLISAVLTVLYGVYVIATPQVPRQLFLVTEDHFRHLLVLLITAPTVAVMTGLLRRALEQD